MVFGFKNMKISIFFLERLVRMSIVFISDIFTPFQLGCKLPEGLNLDFFRKEKGKQNFLLRNIPGPGVSGRALDLDIHTEFVG